MQHRIPWSDLELFAAVARHGTLAGAAADCGASSATLSRRMTALEASLGRRLFHHGARGYAVTADGAALLSRVDRMQSAATEIDSWLSAEDGPVRVRISAGTWTAMALARDVARFWTPAAAWVPEFVHSDGDLDIARREIDIGIRNRRPDQPWLAGRRTGQTLYAVYGREDATGWIATGVEGQRPPSARWVLREHGSDVVTTANDPRLAVAMAQAGLGRVVLPCFAGETSGLTRLSDPIRDLTSEEWLISHHDARHTPPVRAALKALATYLTQRNHGLGPERT